MTENNFLEMGKWVHYSCCHKDILRPYFVGHYMGLCKDKTASPQECDLWCRDSVVVGKNTVFTGGQPIVIPDLDWDADSVIRKNLTTELLGNSEGLENPL